MTIAAVFYRHSYNDIMALTDSRLSHSHGALTDVAPKITILRITSRLITARGLSPEPVIDASVGIAYAGNSVAAFATIVTAQTILSSLVSKGEEDQPSLSDVAELIRKVHEKNFRSFGERIGQSAVCDFILFGSLPRGEKGRCFNISCNDETDARVTVSELEMSGRHVFAIGSAREQFMSMLASAERQGRVGPIPVFLKMLRESGRADIGGAMQVCIATPVSATILPTLYSNPGDPPEAAALFLGQSVDQFAPIGPCGIGGEGLFAGPWIG